MDQRIEQYLQSAINSLWIASNLIEDRCGKGFDVSDYDRACEVIDLAEDLLVSLQGKQETLKTARSTSSADPPTLGSTVRNKTERKAA